MKRFIGICSWAQFIYFGGVKTYYQISPSRRRDFWRHPRNIANVPKFKINVLLYIMLIFACRFSFMIDIILLKPFIFLLLDSPKCSYKDPKILYGAVGEKLLLLCDMQPFSGPLEFNWTFLGNFVIYIYKICVNTLNVMSKYNNTTYIS